MPSGESPEILLSKHIGYLNRERPGFRSGGITAGVHKLCVLRRKVAWVMNLGAAKRITRPINLPSHTPSGLEGFSGYDGVDGVDHMQCHVRVRGDF